MAYKLQCLASLPDWLIYQKLYFMKMKYQNQMVLGVQYLLQVLIFWLMGDGARGVYFVLKLTRNNLKL